MARFNRESHSNRDHRFNKPRFGSDRPMHKAICARCGRQCEIPFKPTGDRPVFCKDCYNSNEGFEAHRQENRNAGRNYSGNRQMYDAICSNCGNKCQIPFRPTPGRDVLCSSCFEGKENSDSQRFDNKNFENTKPYENGNISSFNEFKSQLDQLNAKMDTVLSLLTDNAKAPPLESALSEEIIDEIAQDVTKEDKKAAKLKKVKNEDKKSKSKKLDSPKE